MGGKKNNVSKKRAKKKKLPHAGLEPAATGLKGPCSTNWANTVKVFGTGSRTPVKAVKEPYPNR